MASDPKSEREIDGDPFAPTEPVDEAVEAEPIGEEPVSEQPTAVEPPPSEPPAERRGGFGAALLGGVVAAVIGFVAGKAGILDPMLPPGWRTPDYAAQLGALEAKITDQSGDLTALREQVGAIKLPDLAPLDARLSAMEPLGGQVETLGQTLSNLESRFTELEKRPISEGVSPEAIAAYERELQRMQAALEAQRAEVDRYVSQARDMEAEAGQSRQLAAQRNAMTRLQTALVGGDPYAPMLAELRDSGLDIPGDLTAGAEAGVPTLAALRAAFPDAARRALAAARESSKGDNPGFSAFLARQFGARSVQPRSGDDPDAVLSRAEAAVTDGRIDTALSELDTLPEAARAEMTAWIADARARQSALAAADTLAQSLAAK
ncbi:MAG: hypothetical protein KDK24_12050 [Pseudooceanicola sp.]|nr:hypothetical protein [Pseudooceanicola sp.]